MNPHEWEQKPEDVHVEVWTCTQCGEKIWSESPPDPWHLSRKPGSGKGFSDVEYVSCNDRRVEGVHES